MNKLNCDECPECTQIAAELKCKIKYKTIPARVTIYGLVTNSPYPTWCPKIEKDKKDDNLDSRYGKINKAVLVLTIPNGFTCKDCPCYDDEYHFCNIVHDFVEEDTAFSFKCPLKRLPDKNKFDFDRYSGNQHYTGYLAGIYEVLRRLEEEAR